VSLAGSSGYGGITPASATDAPPTVEHVDPATPPIRRLAGRFLLERQLRSTGAADIWQALDEKLNRAVAVYLMRSGAQTTTEVLGAARLAAAVPDTRFVQVLDAVDDGSSAYVVTEWLTDAVDLASRLSSGVMPSWEAVSVASEVAEAMASAHAFGLTHQRLDPHNVLRTESGQVKIHGLRLEATLAGLVPATPEDARAADVRGIGALLYACLTAHWPWGEGYGLAAAPHDSLGPTTPASLRRDVPPDVDSVTMRLLSSGIPLPDAAPPPAPSEGEEETLAVPRLPLASCEEAVEALSVLRRSRPQPQTPPQYPLPPTAAVGAPGPATGYPGPGYPGDGYGQGYGPEGYPGGGYPGQPYGGYHPDQYGPQAYGAPGYGPPTEGQGYGPPTQGRGYGLQPGGLPYGGPGGPGPGPGAGSGRGGWGQGAGARRIAMAAVAVLVVAGLGLLGWKLIGQGQAGTPKPGASTSSSTAPQVKQLAIAHASLWQASTSDEHSSAVGNTITGAAPAWGTFGYFDGPKMKIKPGTGIIYDLGAVRTVRSVKVQIGAASGADGSQAVLELRAAGPDVAAVPPVEAGKAPPGFDVVDAQAATSTEVTLTAKAAVRTRFVLVWFTSLPNLGVFGSGGQYHDSISLVKVYGSE
jgi:hypothetical protein